MISIDSSDKIAHQMKNLNVIKKIEQTREFRTFVAPLSYSPIVTILVMKKNDMIGRNKNI